MAESGLWRHGATRTTPSELAELIRAGQIAVATRDGLVVGSVRVHDVADDTSEFGMLVRGKADQRGTGVGRALIDFAEQHNRERGRRAMQLELLLPRESGSIRPRSSSRRGMAVSGTGSSAPPPSTTSTRTSRRCWPPRATSRSTRSPSRHTAASAAVRRARSRDGCPSGVVWPVSAGCHNRCMAVASPERLRDDLVRLLHRGAGVREFSLGAARILRARCRSRASAC